MKKYLGYLYMLIFFMLFFLSLYNQNLSTISLFSELGETYTTALITSQTYRPNSYDFTFTYGVETVRSSSTGIGKWATFEDRVNIGERVYIVFPKGMPEKAEIFLDFDVPSNLPEPPPGGWTLQELQQLDPHFKPGEPSTWFWP